MVRRFFGEKNSVKLRHWLCEIRRLSGETIFVDIIKEEFERFVEEDDDDHFLLVKKNAADSDGGGCVTWNPFSRVFSLKNNGTYISNSNRLCEMGFRSGEEIDF